jgi:glucose-1-phosphate cytidylyltransferase
MSENSVEIHNYKAEPWKVTMLYTGANTLTGGRIARAKEHLKETFMLTYGDGVSDVDLNALIETHKRSGKIATVTSVQPEGKFGALAIESDNSISSFAEKPKGDGAYINGGFFVCEPEIFDYIKSGDKTIFEREPLEDLARAGQLGAFKHKGFWKAMDTLYDKNQLTALWEEDKAPWAIWKK